MQNFKLFLNESKIIVKRSSDDPHTVAASNFLYGKVLGNKRVPVNSLIGGIRSDDPREAKRVIELQKRISGPGGYVSRLLIDTDKKVLEGQHRLEALRNLKFKKAPVTVIKDLSKGFDLDKIQDAIKSNGIRHSDNVHQMTYNVLDTLHDEPDIEKILKRYSMPEKYHKAWEAALRSVQK